MQQKQQTVDTIHRGLVIGTIRSDSKIPRPIIYKEKKNKMENFVEYL